MLVAVWVWAASGSAREVITNATMMPNKAPAAVDVRAIRIRRRLWAAGQI
jgi:hypothetical protein